MADPSQLGQVFQNLVANSIKFRGTDPPLVEIRAREDGDFWEFSVRDNGIGFGQEHHDRIFSMFQRLHSREHYEGSGIGLAIAKRIVERHGGKMWATSERGKGSCFYFTLHRAVARASEAP
jgi:signal transduction histidine kinase